MYEYVYAYGVVRLGASGYKQNSSPVPSEVKQSTLSVLSKLTIRVQACFSGLALVGSAFHLVCCGWRSMSTYDSVSDGYGSLRLVGFGWLGDRGGFMLIKRK